MTQLGQINPNDSLVDLLRHKQVIVCILLFLLSHYFMVIVIQKQTEFSDYFLCIINPYFSCIINPYYFLCIINPILITLFTYFVIRPVMVGTKSDQMELLSKSRLIHHQIDLAFLCLLYCFYYLGYSIMVCIRPRSSGLFDMILFIGFTQQIDIYWTHLLSLREHKVPIFDNHMIVRKSCDQCQYVTQYQYQRLCIRLILLINSIPIFTERIISLFHWSLGSLCGSTIILCIILGYTWMVLFIGFTQQNDSWTHLPLPPGEQQMIFFVNQYRYQMVISICICLIFYQFVFQAIPGFLLFHFIFKRLRHALSICAARH